jgi:hypothetical protein
LAHFVFIWSIFSSFGIMYQEKSGNPDGKHWQLEPLKSCPITWHTPVLNRVTGLCEFSPFGNSLLWALFRKLQ